MCSGTKGSDVDSSYYDSYPGRGDVDDQDSDDIYGDIYSYYD